MRLFYMTVYVNMCFYSANILYVFFLFLQQISHGFLKAFTGFSGHLKLLLIRVLLVSFLKNSALKNKNLKQNCLFLLHIFIPMGISLTSLHYFFLCLILQKLSMN